MAAQRSRGLSPGSILRSALSCLPAERRSEVWTLIRRFAYPRRGPGMMRQRDLVEAGGGRVILGAPGGRVYWVPGRILACGPGGRLWLGEHSISSIAPADLVRALEPDPRAICSKQPPTSTNEPSL